MAERAERRARVEELLRAARTLADATSAASQRWRQRVLETSGLSRPSIDFAIERCLEQRVSDSELERLLELAPPAPRALVLLSANVFVAPLRAIALARASSADVVVRASRRDPTLAEALAELTPGAFTLTTELTPRPGDQLWAYGANETLTRIAATLPAGVVLHGHGFGLGAVVVDYRAGARDPSADAHAIAVDAALFDQHGCLSPRLVCVLGDDTCARRLATALAHALAELEKQLPPGAESALQLAERRRFSDAATYAFEVTPAGRGFVSLALDARLEPAPSGRNLHVARVSDAVEALLPLGQHLTCIATKGPLELERALASAFPGARRCGLGQMQTPPLDGPVDLRAHAPGRRPSL